jgi:16S rRNA (uracil1498-N3)-methyltransferase
MSPRLYVEQALHADALLSLPPGPARHVQVLRLQPGAEITLFNGEGGEWRATVQQMGRSEVQVRLHERDAVDRELPQRITLAIGMPANERMDALVEKATELGVAALQPLLTERSVLRLSGERAERRLAHWQGVAVAASEQSGRTRVPTLAPVRSLAEWLRALPADASERRCVLSPRATDGLRPLQGAALFLSGPEGGLSEAEEGLARAAGFTAVGLGPRVLRADTAPLAVLAHLALGSLSL